MSARTIYAGITMDGRLKVGSTVNLDRRCRQLDMALLEQAPGEYRDELDLIHLLGEATTGREWFEPTRERLRIVREWMAARREEAARPVVYDLDELWLNCMPTWLDLVGTTDAQLCDSVGISLEDYRRYTSTEKCPTPIVLRIAAVLGVSPGSIAPQLVGFEAVA